MEGGGGKRRGSGRISGERDEGRNKGRIRKGGKERKGQD